MQKPERCAKHSSLFRPQDAVAVFASCAWPIFAARGGARLRKPERCAKHSSLFHPQDAVAVFALLRFACFCRRQRLSSAVPGIPF